MTEAPGLYLRLTVFDNLEYSAGLYGVSSRDSRDCTIRRRDQLAGGH
jgi:ABC-type multidrug transport system ATPase subunit